MAEIAGDCPRCGTAHVTFDVKGDCLLGREHGWSHIFEAFCVCRRCKKGTIFVLSQEKANVFERRNNISVSEIPGSVEADFGIRRFISVADVSDISPPEHLPENINNIFEEAARCMSSQCWNAAGTMFRLSVDLATAPLLPEAETAGLTQRMRRDLGLRLPWLFDNAKLPEDLRDLSACIREDGNDGAHRGTLTASEAEDLLDFTTTLLERIYTIPARVRLAAERRNARRAN